MVQKRKNSRLEIQKVMTGILIGVMILILYGMSDPLAAQAFDGGSGTVGDPYQISAIEQLQAIKDNLASHFILVNDIDASATSTWNESLGFEPLGNTTTHFTGSLNGEGYVISGLTINRPVTNEVGLFGYIRSEGTLTNISLENVNITGNYNAGGLAGYNLGTITSSYISGDVSASNYNAGGMAGANAGTITKSHSTGTISSSSYNIGGLVGSNIGTITNSYSTGTVNSSMHNVGGLVGINESIIRNSYSIGSVTGNSNTGGLIGYNLGTVTDSFWDTQTSGMEVSSEGTGKTTAEMQMHATFTDAGWNFTETWAMDEGSGYPFFQDEGYSELTLTGSEGWRMMSSPSGEVSFATLLDTLWTQGLPGADDPNGSPNILLWNEVSRTWTAPANTSVIPEQGAGFLVYLYSDDDNDGADEGFPKVIRNAEGQYTGSAAPELSFTSTDSLSNDGWNLVGNPYGASLDWDAGSGWSKTNLDNAIYIWSDSANGGTGAYLSWNGESGTLADGKIAPWQGFWVKANAASPGLSFSNMARSSGGVFRKEASVPQFRFTLEGNGLANQTVIMFDKRASFQPDHYDTYKLASLKTRYLSLGTSVNGIVMDTQALPLELDQTAELALNIEGSELNGEFSLTWESQDIPQDWTASLVDSQTGSVTDLLVEKQYMFTLGGPVMKRGLITPLALLSNPKMMKSIAAPRFSLVLEKRKIVSTEGSEESPSTIALNQNYPNPFNPSTVIGYQLPATGRVQLVVFDMLGREIATLVDEQVSAGTYQVIFDASRLASGIYLYRLRAGNSILTKKLTLIK